MEAYRYQGNSLVRCGLLWKAINLSWRSHQVISLVGAGGKTTVMYRLAQEAAAMGKRVVVTTSTHIFCPEEQQTVLTDQAEEVKSHVRPGRIVVAGVPVNDGKLKGLPVAELSKLAEIVDVLLIEADGAKRFPLKIPNDQEPVIIPRTDLVIGCCGLDCIGHSVKECCFRGELAGQLPCFHKGHIVTLEDVVRIMTSAWGTRKSVESCDYRIVLNKADTDYDKEVALTLARRIMELRQELCAVTSFKKRDD